MRSWQLLMLLGSIASLCGSICHVRAYLAVSVMCALIWHAHQGIITGIHSRRLRMCTCGDRETEVQGFGCAAVCHMFTDI
jgi:hypothetical protein